MKAVAARYAAILPIMTAVAALVLFGLWVAGAPDGKPNALDFTPYWVAGQLVLQGHGRELYQNAFIETWERAHFTMPGAGYLAFYYPPPFLLLCLPLALLPYLWALWLFLGAQAALLWAALRRVLPAPWALAPLAVFPGFLMNAFSGQNGGLTAACLAWALLWLETRPLLAGACLGALVYKPQMALAVPFALLPARRWRAAFAAGAMAAGLCLLSRLLLGGGPWAGFLANAPAARADLEQLAFKWHMMQSFYAGLRLAGGSLAIGYAGQALCAGAALFLLGRIAWQRRGAGPEMAALATATLLVTPFLYDYDLVLLAVPLTWLAAKGTRTGFLAGDRPVMLCLYGLPFVARAVGVHLGVPLAPPLVLACLLLIWRRRPHGMSA